MKKLLALSLVGTSFFIGLNRLNAEDYDAFGIDYSGDPSIGNRIYGVDSATGNKTLLSTKVFDNNAWQPGESFMSAGTGEIMVKGYGENFHAYNWRTDTWRDVKDNANFQKYFYKPSSIGIDSSTVQIGSDANDIDVVEDGLNIDGAAVITKNTDGSVQIGADGNDIDITAEGLNIDGNPLITQKENGEIHIGKNSLITTKEEKTLSDGTKVQPLYAEDADGNRIPINIDGSKLLIDGVEVTAGGSNAQIITNKNNISTNKTNIKNLGEGVAGSTALTAALSALPQTSKESKLSCGVGTGAYSSRYAVGFGCASKVNKRVDINAGGSYVFGGSKSYGGGTLDSGVVKAGFVFKLGELNKSTQISMKDKKNMETKIETLSGDNEILKNKVTTLMARLERLEKIASRDIKSNNLAHIDKQ